VIAAKGYPLTGKVKIMNDKISNKWKNGNEMEFGVRNAPPWFLGRYSLNLAVPGTGQTTPKYSYLHRSTPKYTKTYCFSCDKIANNQKISGQNFQTGA